MLQDAATRELLAREGADPPPLTPEEFASTIAADGGRSSCLKVYAGDGLQK